MKGLILKDLFNLRKQAKIYSAFIVCYLAISVLNQNSYYIGSLVCMFCAMLPITALAFDERCKWDKFALSLPISRKDLVLGKYLLGLITSVIGAAIVFIFNLFSQMSTVNNALFTLAILGCGIVLFSFILPLMYKFGVEKGRLWMMLAIFIPIIIVNISAQTGITLPADISLNWIPYAAPFLVIAVFALSYALSVKIFAHKDL